LNVKMCPASVMYVVALYQFMNEFVLIFTPRIVRMI